MSLPPLDRPGPHAADGPDGQLGGAPDLVALHEPSAAPDLVPQPVVQRTAPEPNAVRRRRRIRNGLATAALHVAFVALFLLLLAPRPDLPDDRDVRPIEGDLVKVEAVVETPKPDAPKPEAKPEAPKPGPTLADLIPQPAPPPLAPAPDPHPPAPPAVQPPPAAEAPAKPEAPAKTETPQAGDPSARRLFAPPPEPARAKTQPQKSEKPNAEPDESAQAKAKREARPVEAQKVLSTANPKAGFAVPAPDAPKPGPPAPAPDAPRQPSETEKLAAVLPSDTSALPESFRAVLSGNGASVDTAYKGLVFGRFHAAEIGERARQMNLRGQVIVAFSIDDDGGLKSLAVLQSSGNPAVDALGLDMIRSAAPFPPPPPGAQRSFTPAFAFGE